MVRFWPRHLRFGEARKRSSQMAHDPTFSPIFEEPVVATTPMWRSSIHRENEPALVDYDNDEADSHQPMWYREASGHHSPGCPCCIEGTGFPRPPSSALASDYGRIRKMSRASTNLSRDSADSEAGPAPDEKYTAPGPACDPTVRVRSSVSSFSLKVKKSMRSLRGMASGNLGQ